MTKQEARAKFQQADGLFQQRRYAEALLLLDELDEEFPGERRILYPKARCLAKLKRYDEAQALTETIIAEHRFSPAHELLQHIRTRKMAAASADDYTHLPSDLDSILNTPAAYRTAPPPLPSSRTSPQWFGPALVIGIALLVLIGGAFGQARWGDAYDEWIAQANAEGEFTGDPPVGGILFTILFYLPVGLAVGSLAGYLSLLVVKRLPYDDFWSNVKDIFLYVVYCSLLAFVPLVGWVFIPYILYKHYETSFWDLVVMALVYILVAGVLEFAVSFVIGLGSLAFA